jgi:hypothetical protein
MVIVEQTPVIDLGQRVLNKSVDLFNELDNRDTGVAGITSFPPQHHLSISAPPRTPGLHASGLIRSAAIKYNLLKPQTRQQVVAQAKEQEFLRTFASFGGGGTGATFEEDVPLIVFMGLCWEDRLQQQYPDMLYHPGEFELDGVYMSPDGLEKFNGIKFVDEIKLTYKSMSTPFEFQTLYHIQTKAYCYRLKTNYCRFHVLYVNGNYTDIRGPHYRVYDCTYSDLELRSNWEFLMRHKAFLIETGGLEEIMEKAA